MDGGETGLKRISLHKTNLLNQWKNTLLSVRSIGSGITRTQFKWRPTAQIFQFTNSIQQYMRGERRDFES